MNHTRIQELPISERPYEKAETAGVSVLSDAELLAVILKSGTPGKTSVELARQVLASSETFPGLMSLYHAKLPDLMRIPGIGRVKALQLLCIAELSKRMARLTRTRSPEMRNPENVAGYFMEEMRSLETEHFYVMLLDASDRLIRVEALFKGTVRMSTVSPREALRLALAYDAAGMIILHNHPSGDPIPSPADKEVTLQFGYACDMLDIPLLDHIIIGDNTYVSFAETGLLVNRENNYGKE